MSQPNPLAFMNPLAYSVGHSLGTDVSASRVALFKMRTEDELLSLGAYLATMQLIADERVGTAATDCIRVIRYAPSYMEKMRAENEKLPISVFMHEIMHKKQAFMLRFERWVLAYPNHNRRDLLRVFNEAADYWCNWVIRHEWNYPIHKTWLYRYEWSPRKYTTESLADYLLEHPEERPPAPPVAPPPPCEGGDGGGSSDEESEPNEKDEGDAPKDNESEENEQDGDEGSGEEEGKGNTAQAGAGSDILLPEEYKGNINNVPTAEQLREMEHEIMQDDHEAQRMAKGAAGNRTPGKGSGGPMNREYLQYVPAVDFRGALQRFANKAVRRGKLTWYRANPFRRTSQGIPMPGKHGKEIGTGVFCIDSSGSTAGALVKYYLDETESALRQLEYGRIALIWCDSMVKKVQEFSKQEAMRAPLYKGKVYGGGGTALFPAIEHAVKEYPDARFLCYLTDGGTSESDIEELAEHLKEHKPGLPILWVLDNEDDMCCQWFAEKVKPHGHTVIYVPRDWQGRVKP